MRERRKKIKNKFVKFLAVIITAAFTLNAINAPLIPLAKGFELTDVEIEAEISQTATTKKEEIAKSPESLVAILIHESFTEDNDLLEQIQMYAKDIQNSLPRTKAKLIRVREGDTVNQVISVLDRLYFEGESNRKLRGIVLIGPVPIPVISRNEEIFPSIYPYVDLEEKAYEWSEEKQAFVRSPHVPIPRADIWHGVITPPKKGKEGIEMLKTYFEKNHAYHTNPEKFFDAEKRIMIADLKYESENLSRQNFPRYANFLKYLEDLAYHRYSKNWLKLLAGNVKNDLQSLIEDQKKNVGKFWRPEKTELQYGEAMLQNLDSVSNNLPDIQTKAMIEAHLLPYIKLFSKYLADANDWIANTGRYDLHDLDTLPSLISSRDLEMREFFRAINDKIEQKIDETVTAHAAPLPLQYGVTINFSSPLLIRQPSLTLYNHGETYINGFPFDKIETIEQCSLVRGTAAPEMQEPGVTPQAAVLVRTADPSSIRLNCPKELGDAGDAAEQCLAKPSIGIYARPLTPEEASKETNGQFSYGAKIEDDIFRGRLGIEKNSSILFELEDTWVSEDSAFLPGSLPVKKQKPEFAPPKLLYDDIILSVDGKPLTEEFTLDQVLQKKDISQGNLVNVTYFRKGQNTTTIQTFLQYFLEQYFSDEPIQYDLVNECQIDNFLSPEKCNLFDAKIPILDPAGSYHVFRKGENGPLRMKNPKYDPGKNPPEPVEFAVRDEQNSQSCYAFHAFHEFQKEPFDFNKDTLIAEWPGISGSLGLPNTVTMDMLLTHYGLFDNKDNNGNFYDTNGNGVQEKMQWSDENQNGKIDIMLEAEEGSNKYQLKTVGEDFVYSGSHGGEFIGGDWGIDDPYENDPAYAYPKNPETSEYDTEYLARMFLEQEIKTEFIQKTGIEFVAPHYSSPLTTLPTALFSVVITPKISNKKIPSVFRHNEPTPTTLAMQYNAQMSSTLPIDMPRRISFIPEGKDFRAEKETDVLYPNAFGADSLTAYLDLLQQKEAELAPLINTEIDLTSALTEDEFKKLEAFFTWRGLEINQKHEFLLKTAAEKDYEIFYLNAEGDHEKFGFDFPGAEKGEELASTALPLTSGSSALQATSAPPSAEPITEENHQSFGLGLTLGGEIQIPKLDLSDIEAWRTEMEQWLEDVKKLGADSKEEVDVNANDPSNFSYSSALAGETSVQMFALASSSSIVKPGAEFSITSRPLDEKGMLITVEPVMHTFFVEGPADAAFLEAQDFDAEEPGIQIGAYGEASLLILPTEKGVIIVKEGVESLAVEVKENLFLDFSSESSVLAADEYSSTLLHARVTDENGNVVPYQGALSITIENPSTAYFIGAVPDKFINGSADAKIASTGKAGAATVMIEAPGIGVSSVIITMIPQKISLLKSFQKKVIMRGEDLQKTSEHALIASLLGSNFGDSTKENFLAGQFLMQGRTQAIFAETTATEHQKGFGFTGENLSMLLLAGGARIGEATMSRMPETGIVIGDPLARLTPDETNQDTGFTKSMEREIFSGNEPIKEIITLDFDEDGKKDVLAAYESGSIRMIANENGATRFHDRGEILRVKNGIKSIAAADIDHDDDDDLVIATKEPCVKGDVCVDLYVNIGGFFTRKNLKLAIANRVHELKAADMNLDGYPDIVTSDTGGNIKIFWNISGEFEKTGTFLGQFAVNGDSENALAKISIAIGGNFPDVPKKDDYPDVLAWPDNVAGIVTYFYSHGASGSSESPITYIAYGTHTIAPKPPEAKTEKIPSESEFDQMASALASFTTQKDSDQDGIPDTFDDTPTKLEDAEKTIKNLVSTLRCSGGCLKLPINEAFLVPSQINKTTKLVETFSGIPATLPVFGLKSVFPFVYPLTADDTFFRFYLSPTLTGQLGLAFCAGPYAGGVPKGTCYAYNGSSFIPKNFCEDVNAEISDAIGETSGDVTISGSGLTTVVANGSNSPTPLPPNKESDGGFTMKVPGSTAVYPIKIKVATNVRVPGFPAAVTDFFDRQIEEILNKIGDMPDIYFIYPKLSSLTGAFVPQKKFKSIPELLSYINSIPLVQIQGKEVLLKIPFLTKQEVKKIERDHEQWLADLDTEWNQFKNFWSCNEEKSSPYADLCSKVSVQVTELRKTVDKNIEHLHAWENFPKTLLNYKTYEAKIARQLINYLDTITGYLGGYIARQQKITEQWMKFIKSIKDMALDWQALVDVTAEYVAECDTCKSDRGSVLEALIRMFVSLPTDISIVPFPKLPDFVIDMSNIEIGAKLVWPDLRFRPEPFIVPRLPRVKLPNLPNVEIILPPLAGIPVIEAPPNLPPFPEFPKIPLFKLPDLPPAPELINPPKIAGKIKAGLEGLKNITKIACMLKSGIMPVPETGLKTEIEALTARPLNPLLPFDLSITTNGNPFPFGFFDDNKKKIDLPEQIRVNGKLKLEFQSDKFYNEIKDFADQLNEEFTGDLVKAVNDTLKEKAKEIETFTTPNVEFPEKVKIDFGKKESYMERLKNQFSAYIDHQTNLMASISESGEMAEIFQEAYGFSRFVAQADGSLPLQPKKTAIDTSMLSALTSQNPAEAISNTIENEQAALGILITNPKSGMLEKLISYSENLSGENHIAFSDLDADGDEDIIFSLNGNLYVKENFLETNDEEHVKWGIAPPTDMTALLPNGQSAEILSASYESAIEAELQWSPVAMEDLAGYEITASGAIGTITKTIPVEKLPNTFSPSATLSLPSGNYYATVQAFDADGNKNTISRTVLLTPQDCADKSPPIVSLKETSLRIPVLKTAEIDASASKDQGGTVAFYALDTDIASDSNFDGDPKNDQNIKSQSASFSVGPFTEIGTYGAELMAQDQSGNSASAPLTIEVYAPNLLLTDANAVAGFARGETMPRTPDAHVIIVRERKGAVEEIADIKTDSSGAFNAENLDIKSKTVIKNSEGIIVAEYNPQTETMDILVDGYTVEEKPAQENLPKRQTVKNPDGIEMGSLVIIPPEGKDKLGTGQKPKIVDENFFTGVTETVETILPPEETLSPFADVHPGVEHFDAIAELKKKGIVSGFSENGKTVFKPDQLLTRAEYAKITLETLCISPSEAAKLPPPVFSDIPHETPQKWYYPYAKEGFLQHLIIGYPSERDPVTGFTPFKPDKTITRAEAVMILLRALRLTNVISLSENLTGAKWYTPFMLLAQNLDTALKKPTEGGNTYLVTKNEAEKPEQILSRGDFAEMAARVFRFHDCYAIDNDQDTIPDAFDPDPSDASDANEDPDKDGLMNKDEWSHKTDMFDPDTDDGGVNDGDEVKFKLNPLDPNDDQPYVKIIEEPKIKITKSGPPAGAYIIKEPCNACPCAASISDSADILPGDDIYAVLADPKKEKIYAKSNTLSP